MTPRKDGWKNRFAYAIEGFAAGQTNFLYQGRVKWILSEQVTDQQNKDKDKDKDKGYWIDEIAFLEARLNGSQGDIDNEDRAACEEALKAAKANLAASH